MHDPATIDRGERSATTRDPMGVPGHHPFGDVGVRRSVGLDISPVTKNAAFPVIDDP